jgi:hypothetical protein
MEVTFRNPQDNMKDNLTTAFKALSKKGLYARQNFLCCRNCAGYQLAETVTKAIDKNPNKKNTILGCVFYTKQDACSYSKNKDFYLSYGSLGTTKHGEIGKPTKEVGELVVKVLAEHGVETEWDGDGDSRILVKVNSIH